MVIIIIMKYLLYNSIAKRHYDYTRNNEQIFESNLSQQQHLDIWIAKKLKT